MCRVATGTPTLAATARSDSNTEFLRVPFQPELAGRSHVAEQRRRGHDHRAGEVAFAAEPHAVLPVAIERRDRALAFFERIRSLAEAGAAPRLANLPADRAEDRRDRLACQPCIGTLDLQPDAARAREDHELLRGLRRTLRPRGAH